MIFLDRVTKYYDTKRGRKYILKDVTLELAGEKNIGILGRNGAGKSTFIRMLGGIDFPNSGRISSNYKFSWPLGLSSGFQGSLSGKDNAKFVCRVHCRSKQEQEDVLAFVEDFCELGNYFNMPIKTYSSGMKSRLGFAMSLAFEFDYYLIDETLSVGDIKFRQKCIDALANLKSKSNIILVNHNPGPLKRLCDVGIVIKDAKLHYMDDIHEAIDWYQAQ